jgi:hypothetical protein
MSLKVAVIRAVKSFPSCYNKLYCIIDQLVEHVCVQDSDKYNCVR